MCIQKTMFKKLKIVFSTLLKICKYVIETFNTG